MIKKLLFCLVILLCLTGCKQDEFAKSISTAIKKACNESIPDPEDNNCIKSYYTYYLDKNIGKITGDELSNQFNISGNISALSLDISSIALRQVDSGSDSSLRDIGSLQNTVYTRSGRFFNSSKNMISFKVSIAQLDDSEYFVMIQTNQFIFISNVSNSTCANTIHDMLVLLRTCTVDEVNVVLDNASDSITQSTSTVISLFEKVVPESGFIIDYMDDWKDDTSFITIEIVEDEDDVNEEYHETITDDDVEEDRNDEDNINE